MLPFILRSGWTLPFLLLLMWSLTIYTAVSVYAALSTSFRVGALFMLWALTLSCYAAVGAGDATAA